MKFFIVVRADLTPAQIAVQATHVALAWVAEHGSTREVADCNLALLTVPDEKGLERLLRRAGADNVKCSHFVEEDLGHTITAAAFEPGEKGQKICNGLKKALDFSVPKRPTMTSS